MDGDFINSQDKCLTCSWEKKVDVHAITERLKRNQKKIKKWPFNDMKCFVYELNSKVCVRVCVFPYRCHSVCVCWPVHPAFCVCAELCDVQLSFCILSEEHLCLSICVDLSLPAFFPPLTWTLSVEQLRVREVRAGDACRAVESGNAAAT